MEILGTLDYYVLGPLVVAVFAAASTGAIFPTGVWYQGLTKPSWTPPNWLFPIAWTLLYAAIAYAGYLIAIADGPWQPTAMALWALQLVLNGLWTPVMFGARRIGLALRVIVLFWLSVAAATYVFFQVDETAGLLFLPYLVWVSFAALLNFSIWRLNPLGKSRV